MSNDNCPPPTVRSISLIKPDDIKTQSANITEEFEIVREDKVLPGTSFPLRTETCKSVGFRAIQVVSVSSPDVPLIEKASREITSLLEQGVFVTSNSTETSTEGNNDTTSYEKDIITIVRAEYKVN